MFKGIWGVYMNEFLQKEQAVMTAEDKKKFWDTRWITLFDMVS